MVKFHPGQLGGHAELWGVRMVAFVTTQPFNHVVAVVRGVGAGGGGVGRCFRLYDNDGRERREGWGRVVTTGDKADWDGMMHAVVVVGSRVADRASLPRVIPRTSGAGGTRGTGNYVG